MNVRKKAGMAHPQKIKQRENIRFAMFPAVSALSIPAMIATAKVAVNMKNSSMNLHISLVSRLGKN
jgi:hypothetical protein